MSRLAPPRTPRNQDVRSRAYLTETEVTRLAEAAQALGRHGHRDACMILLAFRHGLRVSELIALRWDMVDLDAGLVHVTRLKQGCPPRIRCAASKSGRYAGSNGTRHRARMCL